MTEETPKYGLDKDARLAAKRARKAEEVEEPEPLDPPFPFFVIAFEPTSR